MLIHEESTDLNFCKLPWRGGCSISNLKQFFFLYYQYKFHINIKTHLMSKFSSSEFELNDKFQGVINEYDL